MIFSRGSFNVLILNLWLIKTTIVRFYYSNVWSSPLLYRLELTLPVIIFLSVSVSLSGLCQKAPHYFTAKLYTATFHLNLRPWTESRRIKMFLAIASVEFSEALNSMQIS